MISNLEKHEYMDVDPDLKRSISKEKKETPLFMKSLQKIKESRKESSLSRAGSGSDEEKKSSGRSKSSDDGTDYIYKKNKDLTVTRMQNSSPFENKS